MGALEPNHPKIMSVSSTVPVLAAIAIASNSALERRSSGLATIPSTSTRFNSIWLQPETSGKADSSSSAPRRLFQAPLVQGRRVNMIGKWQKGLLTAETRLEKQP